MLAIRRGVCVPSVGHPYDAVLHVAGENGTWENATGCDRFPDVCEKSQTVTALLVVSSVAAFTGAVFSEHMKLNGTIATSTSFLDHLSRIPLPLATPTAHRVLCSDSGPGLSNC